jgi:hypothetical protein
MTCSSSPLNPQRRYKHLTLESALERLNSPIVAKLAHLKEPAPLAIALTIILRPELVFGIMSNAPEMILASRTS